MEALLREVAACTLCKTHLPLGPRPVLSIARECKILVVGQAPGTRVHQTGIPWNDPSGEELRRWLNIGRKVFYDTRIFGIMPMGFCYPGKGKSGDLPPRPECAPTWHQRLLEYMPHLKLTLLIGKYAQAYYLGGRSYRTLTENVLNFEDFLKNGYFPLVHPSPRNRLWQRRNPWFEQEVLPTLRETVEKLLHE